MDSFTKSIPKYIRGGYLINDSNLIVTHCDSKLCKRVALCATRGGWDAIILNRCKRRISIRKRHYSNQNAYITKGVDIRNCNKRIRVLYLPFICFAANEHYVAPFHYYLIVVGLTICLVVSIYMVRCSRKVMLENH